MGIDKLRFVDAFLWKNIWDVFTNDVEFATIIPVSCRQVDKSVNYVFIEHKTGGVIQWLKK
jgi:hypothetical protein